MKQLSELNEISVDYKSTAKGQEVRSSVTAASSARAAYKDSGANIQLKEYLFMILLNRANRVIGYHQLSVGGIHGTIADVRMAFSIAVKCLASGMILAHNHPSGQTKPSQADIKLTKQFKKAGEILEIKLLDHIVLTECEYFSFADEGMLEEG